MTLRIATSRHCHGETPRIALMREEHVMCPRLIPRMIAIAPRALG
jgi:hypothetical protein